MINKLILYFKELYIKLIKLIFIKLFKIFLFIDLFFGLNFKYVFIKINEFFVFLFIKFIIFGIVFINNLYFGVILNCLVFCLFFFLILFNFL